MGGAKRKGKAVPSGVQAQNALVMMTAPTIAPTKPATVLPLGKYWVAAANDVRIPPLSAMFSPNV
jgi:hypothetical protein